MTTAEIWDRLDETVRDKFEGKLGATAFRESAVIVFMLATHHVVKVPLTLQQEKELDKLWYGSLSPSHPLHKVRTWVQDQVGDWAQHLDNLHGRRLQHKFDWFDAQVPQMRMYLQRKAAASAAAGGR